MTNRAVVVARLAEWLLPFPEVRGLNLVIGKFLLRTFIYCQLYWKDQIKLKRGREWPILLFKLLWAYFKLYPIRICNSCSHYITTWAYGMIKYWVVSSITIIIHFLFGCSPSERKARCHVTAKKTIFRRI